MKQYIAIFTASLLILFGCSKVSSLSESSSVGGSSSTGNGEQSGIITAGEWNDLENWDFWLGLQSESQYTEIAEAWKMFTNNRISVLIKNGADFVSNATVVLKKNNEIVWTAKSDNSGRAELWIAYHQENKTPSIKDYSLYINGVQHIGDIKLWSEGTNEIETISSTAQNSIELAFIVDATGSMGDEIKFLKEDLKDVLQRVKNENSNYNLRTATVFYRDQKDDYLVKKSSFTNDINSTIDFINKQNAAGGGDFPEAVHSGLNEAISNLQWSENGKTKIVFLLLDAPPHHESTVIENIQKNTIKAAKNGIKIIPISASGIDKETEFLLRYLAIATNGTYVFITNDSGVGNDHIEATVGPYNVEFLNDLMVRLINKYTK